MEMTATVEQDALGVTHLYLPKIPNFPFDNDPDPSKRRRKNIRAAYKVLAPTRAFPLFFLPKYSGYAQCCVTGVDLRGLGAEAFNKPLLEPDTLQAMNDNRTLTTEFFVDEMSGAPRMFTAQMKVDSGMLLRSSYSPDLLQLFWLYTQWKRAEQLERQGTGGSFFRRRGITMTPIPIRRKKRNSMPLLVDELEPLYALAQEHEGKGVQITEYRNPMSGEVDITSIHLDLRVMRAQEEVSSDEASSAVVGE